ncbi:helix-turn-helix domain-containing protein [Streptomyces mangrovi]|uniref:helix-turn-helix domain-containing protein n=1 Tax=Streptomyces mangrovi TaxID=1206892 RepID=UPI00399C4BB2
MTGEYTGRRSRAEARPHHFEQARQWDEEGFWQHHSAGKGDAREAKGPSAGTHPHPKEPSMSKADIRPVHLPPQETETAERALSRVRGLLERHHDAQRIDVTVEDEGAGPLTLPREAVELLATALAHLAAGRGAAVVARNAELTTRQAADLLNVSRPFLVGLLRAGEIEYRTVGEDRRIPASSLLEYRRRDDEYRRQAAEELTRLGRET